MTTRTKIIGRWLVALLALSTFATACGSDSDGGTATDAEVDTTEPQVEETTPPEDTVVDEAEESTEAVELTASDRGVSATTITLGYVDIDWAEVNSKFGQTRNDAPSDEIVQILQDDLNDRGGINGRMVEVTTKKYLPVGSETVVQVCTELTQDTETFAVLNAFLGQGVQDGNLCINETNETIIVGPAPSVEEAERSTVPWVSTDISDIRRGPAFVKLLEDTDRLAELGKFGVLAHFSVYESSAAAIATALEAAGAEVGSVVTLPDNGGDTQATAALTTTTIEKFRSEGVTTILTIGDSTPVFDRLMVEANDLNLLIVNGDRQLSWPANAPEALPQAGVVISNATPRSVSIAEPKMAECLAVVAEGLGFELVEQDQVAEGELWYLGAAQLACQYFSVFEQLAIEAGPELTRDSFNAAIGSIGEISVPGYAFASLGPDKYDARDSLTLIEWNGSTWDVASDQVDVAG